MTIRLFNPVWLGCLLLAATPLWSQVDNSGGPPEAMGPENAEDRMETPPPVSGEAYPTSYASETRANYLLGGLTFGTAYSDNVLGGISDHPVSDVSYSLWPTLTIDQTRSRLHWFLSYAPGFTFYQRTSARNEADQNLSLDVAYRLSPHVTLTVIDSFHKSSNILNQPDLFSAIAVSASAQASTQAVIPPIADQLNNTGNLQFTYQFRPNGMVGISGTFADLHYPNPAEVPGLYDSSSRGGAAFYSHRLSGKHYIGATYQYQKLRAFPTGFRAETQVHSASFFYTVYLQPTFSLSLFGGPQYADTRESVIPSSHVWSPGAGASLGWQGRQTNIAASYSRAIAAGGGLIGAVHQNAASVSVRRQLSRMLSAALDGNYTNSVVIDPILSFSTGGHSISGTASIQRQLGEHLSFGIGYTRLHQTYSGIPVISGAPDTNREWFSVSYQFARPLGR